ncbi:hypothetical protein UlMin_009269 [Ulmus minor]
MALAMSVQFPATPSSPSPALTSHSTPSLRLKPASAGVHPPLRIAGTKKRKQQLFAVDESQGRSEAERVAGEESEQGKSKAELSELGSEIKKAMEERKKEKEGDLLGGVAEEIGEIEWPAFGKVLGTTWVVLGVIAGSSVVLLTLNAVLAEFSDRVFAGRGVQDFFT